MKKVCVVSADKEILELVSGLEYECVGFFDPMAQVDGLHYKNLGDDQKAIPYLKAHSDVSIVFAIDPCEKKESLLKIYGEDRLETICAEDALISETAQIGKGSLITWGVRVLSRARIGKVCKLNVGAQIHHDVVVGDYCTLAPQALLLGHVKLGSRVYVGAGAIVLPRVSVGAGAIIGAGAVVTSDVAEGAVVMGVPARARGK